MNLLVTGVSRGIGLAVSRRLLADKHSVWGLSRTTPEGLSDFSGFRHTACDVGDEPSRRLAASRLDEAEFVPDVVVLNAGIEYEEDLASMEWNRIPEVLRTNLEGSLFWVAHWMNRRPRPPMRFLAVSSLQAIWPDVACPAYSASKAGLSMAFRALRLRHQGEPVSFQLLFLGPVHTSINPRFTAGGHPPPRGVAQPEEVADYIVDSVLPKRHFASYYPGSAGMLCRLGRWIPDGLFERLTRPMRR